MFAGLELIYFFVDDLSHRWLCVFPLWNRNHPFLLSVDNLSYLRLCAFPLWYCNHPYLHIVASFLVLFLIFFGSRWSYSMKCNYYLIFLCLHGSSSLVDSTVFIDILSHLFVSGFRRPYRHSLSSLGELIPLLR